MGGGAEKRGERETMIDLGNNYLIYLLIKKRNCDSLGLQNVSFLLCMHL